MSVATLVVGRKGTMHQSMEHGSDDAPISDIIGKGSVSEKSQRISTTELKEYSPTKGACRK